MSIPAMAVPTLTRKDLLLQMLGSIDHLVDRLLVIDNGAQDVGQLAIPNVREMSVADLRANLGVAASWNLAIKNAFRQDYVLIVSDDVIFPKGALASFERLSGEDRIVLSATWPHWCAFTIGMRIVKEVGLFDERYYPAYYEDTDYLARLDVMGITPIEGPQVQHANSSTLQTPERDFAEHNARSFNENLRLYESKWPFGRPREVAFDPYRWRSQAWG